MARFIQEFAVEGQMCFPHDMLRYDSCFPADEKSSAQMGENLYCDPLRVTLRRVVENKKALPTVARWASFGWTVDMESVVTRPI